MGKADYEVIGSVKLEEADSFIEHSLLELEAYRSIFETADKKGTITGETLDEWKASFITKAIDRYLKILGKVMSLRKYFVREEKTGLSILAPYARMEATVVQLQEFRKKISAMYLGQFKQEVNDFLDRAINDCKKFRKDLTKGKEQLIAEYSRKKAA